MNPSICSQIPELSVILYSNANKNGLTIKLVYALHGIKNELDITHTGIIFHKSAAELLYMAETGAFKNLQTQHFDLFKEGLVYTDDVVRPYVLQSRMPIVYFRPLDAEVRDFPGEMYLRTPRTTTTQAFQWEDLVGKLYEQNWFNLLWSMYKIRYSNSSQYTFCSKLVAEVCVRAGLVKVDWTRISPERLCSTDPSNDILIATHHKVLVLKSSQPLIVQGTPNNSKVADEVQYHARFSIESENASEVPLELGLNSNISQLFQ
ncbi:Hypothetical_protein [Hexamita inflata]|uniref:Hypothetical_protein n=1 Tax=Hexamita inflata TaxID=28002 RepID=A0AA86VTM7_9EUKA|nr:Hypothetical protein HINF_LOCUS65193 [Hexamita inflata]